MKKFKVIFQHQGAIYEKVVEAYTRSDAMGCVCGFVHSCEEIVSNA